jgi:DNA-directed RNA polymerase subunit RPC12/RpoP
MKCPKCGSERCVKAGFNHGRQRYKCRDCGRQITQTEDKNAANRARALYLYMVGLSMNAIARRVGVEPSTVLYWIRNFALRVYEQPMPPGAVVIELDERWHFPGSKKRKFGCGRPIAALPVRSLIGNAGIGAEKP